MLSGLLRQLRRQFPGGTVFAAEHAGGFGVSEDLLFVGIPFEDFTTEAHGDVAEVTNSDGAMGDFAWRGRFFSRDDAIDEVAVMMFAFVQMDLAWADDRIEQRFRSGVMFAAIGPNRAFAAFERDAAAQFV